MTKETGTQRLTIPDPEGAEEAATDGPVQDRAAQEAAKQDRAEEGWTRF